MENIYGIGTSNKYELLLDDDEDDPVGVIKQEELKMKDKPKKIGKPLKQTSNLGSIIKKKESDVSKDSKAAKNKDRGVTFNVKSKSTPAIEDANKKNTENLPLIPSPGWEIEQRKSRVGSRSLRARGITRGRGGGFDNRGKREFDRQSGSDKSGVKPVEKRDGGGARNWGTVKDDMRSADNNDNEERIVEDVLAHTGENKDGERIYIDSPNKETERSMTLDEWKKQQKTKRSVPTFNLRKPGEGEEGNQWKKGYALKKKEQEETDGDEEDTEDDDYRRRGRHRQHVDIELTFADLELRGRGRGARAPRGGRDHIAAEFPKVDHQIVGPSSVQPAPKVDDMDDFPSLAPT